MKTTSNYDLKNTSVSDPDPYSEIRIRIKEEKNDPQKQKNLEISCF
jgi:hypothetical protein